MARYSDRGTLSDDYQNCDDDSQRIWNEIHDEEALELIRACRSDNSHHRPRKAQIETPTDEIAPLQYALGVAALVVFILFIIIVPALF